MNPIVHLIKDLHLTTTDKRNILATIIYLEKNFTITPRALKAGTYSVVIRETHKNGYGAKMNAATVYRWVVKFGTNSQAPLRSSRLAEPDLAGERVCSFDSGESIHKPDQINFGKLGDRIKNDVLDINQRQIR